MKNVYLFYPLSLYIYCCCITSLLPSVEIYVLIPIIIIRPTYVSRGNYKMMAKLRVCCVPRPNWRTERPRKLKIGRMEWVTREPI